jgi:hypothetical protein
MTTKHTTAVLAVAALLALVAIAPAPAAGQSGDETTGPLLFGVADTEQETDWSAQLTRAAGIVADRTVAQIKAFTLWAPETSASQYADEIEACAAPTDADLAWLNTHTAGMNYSAYDDVTLVIEGADGNTERLYLDAVHDNGSLTNVSLSQTDDSDPVDWTVELDHYATSRLCEDHAWVRENHVATGDAPDKDAAARLGARYAGLVESERGEA